MQDYYAGVSVPTVSGSIQIGGAGGINIGLGGGSSTSGPGAAQAQQQSQLASLMPILIIGLIAWVAFKK